VGDGEPAIPRCLAAPAGARGSAADPVAAASPQRISRLAVIPKCSLAAASSHAQPVNPDHRAIHAAPGAAATGEIAHHAPPAPAPSNRAGRPAAAQQVSCCTPAPHIIHQALQRCPGRPTFTDSRSLMSHWTKRAFFRAGRSSQILSYDSCFRPPTMISYCSKLVKSDAAVADPTRPVPPRMTTRFWASHTTRTVRAASRCAGLALAGRRLKLCMAGGRPDPINSPCADNSQGCVMH